MENEFKMVTHMQNELFRVDSEYLLKTLQKLIDENQATPFSKKEYNKTSQILSTQEKNIQILGESTPLEC